MDRESPAFRSGLVDRESPALRNGLMDRESGRFRGSRAFRSITGVTDRQGR